MYKEIIFNVETGVESFRNYTPEEIEEIEKATKETQMFQAQAIAKEKAKKSALAKLAALGLTEDEIAAL